MLSIRIDKIGRWNAINLATSIPQEHSREHGVDLSRIEPMRKLILFTRSDRRNDINQSQRALHMRTVLYTFPGGIFSERARCTVEGSILPNSWLCSQHGQSVIRHGCKNPKIYELFLQTGIFGLRISFRMILAKLDL